MPYQIKFTETTNPAKPSITVADQSLNNETSLTFVGKNYAGYASIIAENFLHLLENFAKNTAPANPVEGQLWFDNTPGVNLLKVYDGTNWTAAGSIKKASSAPAVANSIKGDVWVDTTNSQLYLFSGSNWLLVGPQYSAGLKTGPNVETIVDTSDISHSVISFWAENVRLAIVSNITFTPKVLVTGFPIIYNGLTVYNSIQGFTGTSPSTKLWGTSYQAEALLVGGRTIPAENFLRSDISSISNNPLSVRANGGISVGSDLSFSMSTEVNSSVLSSKNSGASIDIKLNNSGSTITAIHIDSSAKVGIGVNNTNPQETLDVAGSIIASQRLIISGTEDSTGLGVGSIATAGGLTVEKKSSFGDDITAYGGLHINNLDINSNPIPGTVFQPGTESASGSYDIGSATRKFRNVYAESFVGSFAGTFTGSLSGSISGSAAKLASPTVFSMTGDVTSTAVSFDGQSNNGTATFTTTITQDLITSKPEITSSITNDLLLVYRQTVGNTGLKKVTKQSFLANVPTVPIGAIFPYAGAIPPTGYLLCDGRELRISDYPALYSIIGYTYKANTALIGASTFALPDLRGRFALGKDNMDNGGSVPSKDSPGVFIDSGGGPANRVTDATADVVGAFSGSEQRTLSVTNLPDHKHNLSTAQAQYYASGLPSAGADPSAVPNLGMPNSSTGSGLPNSGSVVSSQLGVPFNVMNPYLTINYIIFTGTL